MDFVGFVTRVDEAKKTTRITQQKTSEAPVLFSGPFADGLGEGLKTACINGDVVRIGVTDEVVTTLEVVYPAPSLNQ